jgi:hypothetical protein
MLRLDGDNPRNVKFDICHLSTMACDGNDWTAPVPATQVMTAPAPATHEMKHTSHRIRSQRVWTRSRCWYVALSVALVVASSACAFVGADEIVVGEHTYRTPFTQYPPLVAETPLSRPADHSSEEGPDGIFYKPTGFCSLAWRIAELWKNNGSWE